MLMYVYIDVVIIDILNDAAIRPRWLNYWLILRDIIFDIKPLENLIY